MDCFQLKMFAVASAVQDVSQLPMSGFQFALFLILLGWRKLLIRDRCPNDGSLFYVCRQLLFYFYAGSCYFMYAESRYFISMLTAVQEQRSRLFYVYLIYAESRT